MSTFRRSPDRPAVLGLLFEGYDPSATLIRDGRIVAIAEEERLTRVKHAPFDFPTRAASYCLEAGGIDIADVDYVAVGWDATKFPLEMAEFYLNVWRTAAPDSDYVLNWQQRNLSRYTAEGLSARIREHLLRDVPVNRRPKIRFVPHHFAHACSAFLLSGFSDAAIITADGYGEDDCTNLWIGEHGRIRHLAQWRLPASLGWFYTKFTQWFGFEPHDGEGKLMGLAAYGKPDAELARRVGRVLQLTGGEDVYRIEPSFFFGQFGPVGPYTKEWTDLFGEPWRGGAADSYQQYHHDLAFAVQSALEGAGLALMRQVLAITGQRRVCVAGGTFMNCKMNGLLAAKVGYSNFFAQPLAGDNGISLGAALGLYHQLGITWTEPLRHVYYGPSYRDESIEDALRAARLRYRRSPAVAKETAQLLANSAVVGWFQGRMEAGARALGGRSILANPLDPEMNRIVNTKVKFREPWRPFCPSAIRGEGERYFEYEGDLNYMIVACKARAGVNALLPSIVHVDDTVRLQTVHEDVAPQYYRLIEEFKALTGYGVILNTSFNVKGEPIVCSPAEAIACYLRTGIDALVIGDYIVTDKVPLS